MNNSRFFFRAAGAFFLAIALAACSYFETDLTRGYVLQPGALEQIQNGSSKEQVQFLLGTPSTTSTIGGDAYYYITQQVQNSPFMGPQITDQRVVAVYFDKNGRVTRTALYGMSDGKVIDFVSRTTPTAGREMTFIQQILSAVQK